MQSEIEDLIRGKSKPQPQQPEPETGYAPPFGYAPPEFMKTIGEAEEQYGIPRNMYARMIGMESGFDPTAIGPETKYGRAVGIAQIMPKFHPNVDPTNPHASLRYGAKYLKTLHDKYGSWDMAAAAYNWGEGNLDEQGMANLPKETRNYIAKIRSGSEEDYSPIADLIVNSADKVKGNPSIEDLLRKPKVNPAMQYYTQNLQNMLTEVKRREEEAKKEVKPEDLWQGPPTPPPMLAETYPGETSPFTGLQKTTEVPRNLRPPGPAENFIQGTIEAVNPVPLIEHAWDLWQKGDAPGLINLATGGLFQETPTHLAVAGQELMNARPTAALAEVAQAVPYFGPIATQINEHIKEGEYAKALGVGVGSAALFKGMQVAHGAVSNWRKARAAQLTADEVADTNQQLQPRQDQINQITDEQLKQVQQQALDMEKKQKEADAVRTNSANAVIGQDIENTGGKIAAAKEPPEWPPRTPEAQRAAEAALRRGMPSKEELLAAQKAAMPEQAAAPGTLAQPTPERPLAGIEPEKPVTSLADLGGAGRAIIDNLYGGIFKALQEGKSEFAGVKDPLIAKAKPFFDRGEITSPEELADFANDRGKFAAYAGPERRSGLPSPYPKGGPLRRSTDQIVAEAVEAQKAGKTPEQVQAEQVAATTEAAQKAEASAAKEAKAKTKKAAALETRVRSMLAAGKDIEQISFDTNKSAAELQPIVDKVRAEQAAPKTDVDLQTGSSAPPTLTPAESPFRQTPEETKARTPFYARNRSVANSVDELFNQDPLAPRKDVSATMWKLRNDVNRWLEGEDIPIEQVRNLLSDIVTNADNWKEYFGTEKGEFQWWKETVSELAKWSREVDRPKIERTTTPLDAVLETTKSANEVLIKAGEEPIPTPKVELPEITGAQMDAIEKHFGKDIDEIPNEDIIKYLNEHPGPSVPTTSLYSGLDPFEAAKVVGHWYSMLKKVAAEKLPRIAGAEQIKNTLRKAVTQDEWKTSQLDEFLKPGTRVSKDEVLAHLDRVLPEFKDVILTERPPENVSTNPNEPFYVTPTEGGTKYSSYVEPGGTNYKELFVTAPDMNKRWVELMSIREPLTEAQQTELDSLAKKTTVSQEILDRVDELYNLDAERGLDARQQMELIGLEARMKGRTEWQDGHADYSDIENPIVRLRFNDRVDSQGNKVLFIEELQPPTPENQAKMPPELAKRWREIGMKRAIKYGIENGYDKVAWTTGEMQLRRYNKPLQEHLHSVNWWTTPEGLYGIEPLFKEGAPHFQNATDVYEASQLPAVVGRYAADKILNSGVKSGTLSPVEVQMSAGLAKVYDTDLPNVARKLGGKVESIDISTGRTAEHNRTGELVLGSEYRRPPDISSVPSVDLSNFKQSQWTPTLYSGIPIDEAAKVLSAFAGKAKEFWTEFGKSVAFKKFDLNYAIKQIKADTVRSLFDQSETLLKFLRSAYPEESQRVIDRQRSAPGGRGYGGVVYDQITKDVYSGQSNAKVNAINAYTLARRFKDIYGYKSEQRYKHQPGYGAQQSVGLSAIMEMIGKMDDGAWQALKRKVPQFEEMFDKFSAADMADIVKRGNTLFDWSKKIVDDLVEAGLKTEEEGKLLKSHDFRKFKSISVEKLYDFDYNLRLRNETIASTNSGVQSLGWGSTKMLEPDYRIILSEQCARVYGAIANNAAKLEWKKLAEKHPENGIVSLGTGGPVGWEKINVKYGEGEAPVYFNPKIKDMLEFKGMTGRTFYDYFQANPDSPYFVRGTGLSNPAGWSEMPYFEKGIQKSIYFHPDAAKYLVTRSQDISGRLTRVLRFAFAAPLTRGLAVATSPAWSTFVGLPMDVMHTLFTARVWEADAKGVTLSRSFPFFKTVDGRYKMIYSAFNPISPLKLGLDLARTFTDVTTRGPLYHDYMKYGGSMPFLTMRESRYFRGLRPPGNFAKLMDVLSYHGNSMELWVRMAVADRIIRNRASELGLTYEQARMNKDIMYEAVHAGRDRMDYNQGGWLVKAADKSGMIFLNAGVLGARTYWRTALSNPVDFTMRTAQIGAVAAGVTATGWLLYSNVMKEIPSEGNEKNVTFPLFPNYINWKDKDGNTRYFYAKLRMDPGPAFSYQAFSKLTQTYLYDKGLIQSEPDYKKLVGNLKQLGPIGLSLPPTVQQWVDYRTNYSWWKERRMYEELQGKTLSWPKSRFEGVEDPNVPAIAKMTGSVTGLSPKRLQGSITNVIPTNNEFVYLFGKGFEEAFSDLPPKMRQEHWLQSLAEFPAVNRVIGITQPGYDRKQTANEAELDQELIDMIRDTKFNSRATQAIWYKARPIQDALDVIAEQKDPDIVTGMRKRLEFIQKTTDLPYRSVWLSLWHMTPQAKAREFVTTLNSLDPAGKAELWRELGQVGNIGTYITEDFRQELAKISAPTKP